MSTVVDRLYTDFTATVAALDAGEVSLRVTAEDTFRKALLLAAASHFERRVKEQVLELAAGDDRQAQLVSSLIRNKAVERQYHTFFGWSGKNANSFFGLFGEDFKQFMTSRVAADDEYGAAIKAFLDLGNDRNRLVHGDFGNFALEKTSDEIYASYQLGVQFVENLRTCFEEFVDAEPAV